MVVVNLAKATACVILIMSCVVSCFEGLDHRHVILLDRSLRSSFGQMLFMVPPLSHVGL